MTVASSVVKATRTAVPSRCEPDANVLGETPANILSAFFADESFLLYRALSHLHVQRETVMVRPPQDLAPPGSTEHILHAAALASGVTFVVQPLVVARRLEHDGVVYEITFTIPDNTALKKAEHDIITSVLACLRDARITVSFPTTELIPGTKRLGIADRFNLVQQFNLFRGLPEAVCKRIVGALMGTPCTGA